MTDLCWYCDIKTEHTIHRLGVYRFMVRFVPGSYDQPWGWCEEYADLRKRDRKGMKKLIKDIKRNGILDPVLVGSDHRVWDGHHRIVAANQIWMGQQIPFEIANEVNHDTLNT